MVPVIAVGGGSILAPTRVACFLTHLEDVPPLVAVREFYTRNLVRFWGAEETRTRLALQKLAEGRANKGERKLALGALQDRCIPVVITARSVRRQKATVQGLTRQGFEVERMHGYDLWVRAEPQAACSTR